MANAVSFFSGIGGFDLGFERAGVNVTHQIENDKFCLKVLTRRFQAEQLGDIENAQVPNADIFFGGFPCQDLSAGGGRAGLVGKRSGLWRSYYKAVKKNRPQWVVIENVSGLLSSNKGRDLFTIANSLVECGYSVCWRILNARHFGVPQDRRRIFVVASLGDGRCAEVLLEPEGLEWYPAPIEEEDTTRDNEGHDPYCIAANGPGDIWKMNIFPTIATKSGGNMRLFVKDLRGLVRRVTPVELERAQGFPDGWTEGLSDTQRYKQLGNAVCVPVAQWVANRLMKAL